MITATLQSKKKLIDLKEDTFKALSIMAVQQGTTLKSFIESILDKAASNYDDACLYEFLSENDPEGKQPLSAKEKDDFEKWLDA